MYQKCIMRIEIMLFLISSFVIANIYTDGNILKKALSFKKYYQMVGVAIGTLFIYYLVKKNPLKTREILIASNDYIKYLPIDKSASDMISPIINFTTKNIPHNEIQMNSGETTQNGGVVKTKRSVSETKKKFVASRQNWRCGECKEQLKASFEVDHIVRLEHGGSNHIDNLVALCRGCHGDKTTIENL
jgi:5-methylcytosine-specific restriction endonuclease McrA